ncbi:MAG: lamin tail domain-containing protein [Byssovorax sp.]
MRFTPFPIAVASALVLLPIAVGCGGGELTGGTTSTSGDESTSTAASSSATSSAASTSSGSGGAGGGSTSSTSAAGTGGGSTTSTGSMGTGGMAGNCATAADCPDTGSVCITATCVAGQCTPVNVAGGTKIAVQTPGNCHDEICDDNGAVASAVNNNDVPVDGKSCTGDVCTAGVPSNPPAAQGTSCGGVLVCDGNGACLGCNQASDCPGMDTECQTRTCAGGACGLAFQPVGTVIATQVGGDCHMNECNGSGTIVSIVDPNDPSTDGNQCTADTCVNGAPVHTPLPAGTACAQMGGKVCSANGACVQCTTAADCSSGSCVNNACETCTDGAKNGNETGVDCGGSCIGCAFGSPCNANTDCGSGVCTNNICLVGGVLSTSPADGATAVLESSPLAITFTGPMMPATLTAQTTSGACTGSIQVSTDGFATCLAFAAAAPVMSAGNSVATLVAAPGFSYGNTFKVKVTSAAKDSSGSAIAAYTSATGFATRLPASACTGAGFVVISQVYGAGGNNMAIYKNDYVELHNRGSQPVNLTGWSVQYAAATGMAWSKTALTGTIAAGGYFLVQEQSAAAIGADLPTPDATGAIGFASTAGKIALVNDGTTLVGMCPVGATIVDFAGYGVTANCFEGTGPTPAPNGQNAATRLGAGCTDTGQNATDFTAAAPTPRNSASPAQVCTCGGDLTLNDSGQPAEADYCVIQFPNTTISVQTGTMTPLVYGRIFEAGVTPAAGAAAGVVAQVGYGPASVNPEWQSGWQFFPASFNVQVGNDDEYQASFTAPAVGSYRYAYRFSQNGTDWTYCDTNGAGSNASLTFETTQLPTLTVTP